MLLSVTYKTMKYTFILVLFLLACSDEPATPELTLPTDLSYILEISEQVEGLVSVEATAKNASFYSIIFMDNSGDVKESNIEGKATHQFGESGTFTIKIRAHATQSAYIEKSENVTILFASDTLSTIPTKGFSTPNSYANYNLVWADEFNGTSLNTSDWNYETGTGNSGWGNNELQYYMSDNTLVKDGVLTITAKRQSVFASDYTSSRLTTQGKKSFQFGRIDIRAALPKGQGLWPAIWMLGNDISSVGWPKCGEIDIMELIGGSGSRDRTVHGTVHWDDNGTKKDNGRPNSLLSGDFSQEWHVFSLIWDENEIKWLRDDIQYHSINISSAAMSEFRQKFFFIFNVAVGGNWPGSPDASTKFPQRMHVDYISVFQRT